MFWMMNVTIVTEVPMIASQIAMMSGPPSLIVWKSFFDSAGGVAASCAETPWASSSRTTPARRKGAEEAKRFFGMGGWVVMKWKS